MPQSADTQIDTLQLIMQAPAFLASASDTEETAIATTKAPDSSTGRVLVAVDTEGKVRIVACPRQAEEAELSTLAAEALATSAKLWHKSYDTFAALFEASLGQSLAEWAERRASKNWTVDTFRSAVEASLQQGRFPVIIVARERNPAVAETLTYLENMNLPVRFVGYTCSASEGVDVVQPVLLTPAPSAQPRTPPPEVQSQPTSSPSSRPSETRSQPADKLEITPRQKELLTILTGLDELKLPRQELEYFLPTTLGRPGAEGTIVLAVSPHRWPFPKPDEVIVVVNISSEHLAGYLRVTPEEIADFLSSLPREERREHKGCILLRASNVGEAHQIVNELKALKEVASGGIN